MWNSTSQTLIFHIYYIIMVSSVQAGKAFSVTGCVIELTWRIDFNKYGSALKPLNRNLFYNHDELHEIILWVLWMHPADIFCDSSQRKYSSIFDTQFPWKMVLCTVTTTFLRRSDILLPKTAKVHWSLSTIIFSDISKAQKLPVSYATILITKWCDIILENIFLCVEILLCNYDEIQ